MDRYDALFLLGIGSIVSGVSMWSRPGALVLLGVFCIAASLLTDLRARARKSRRGG